MSAAPFGPSFLRRWRPSGTPAVPDPADQGTAYGLDLTFAAQAAGSMPAGERTARCGSGWLERLRRCL